MSDGTPFSPSLGVSRLLSSSGFVLTWEAFPGELPGCRADLLLVCVTSLSTIERGKVDWVFLLL